MSAAEKLRALGETAKDALEELSGDAGWAHSYQPGGDSAPDREPDVAVILDALPQIVAVIESAERFEDEDETAMAWANIKRELRAALSALDEALSA